MTRNRMIEIGKELRVKGLISMNDAWFDTLAIYLVSDYEATENDMRYYYKNEDEIDDAVYSN